MGVGTEGLSHSCGSTDADGNITRTFVAVQGETHPVDWNCDGNTTTSGTGFDGNGDGKQDVLKGATADWGRLLFVRGGVGRGSLPGNQVAVPDAGRSGPMAELTFEENQRIRLVPAPATLTYTGSTSADYHDDAAVSATLVDGQSGTPLAGRTVSFAVGASDTCTATTDAEGKASCTIRPTQVPGDYTIKTAFAGDSTFGEATVEQEFRITKEQTTLSLNGPTTILAGSGTATLSATLVEGGANEGTGQSAPPDPSGQTVTFTLGTQTCQATTDAQGHVSCTLASVPDSALGEARVTSTFGGDAYYQPSNASAAVTVFAFPAGGAFVISESALAKGGPVTWWSSSWSTANPLGGGSAPSSFKGFANAVTTLPTTSPVTQCGIGFGTDTGSSAPPPARVPSYMGVLVADTVSRTPDGKVLGTWHRIVVVKTAGGYAPNAGSQGTGTVVATFCG